jgi:hypothetical protein
MSTTAISFTGQVLGAFTSGIVGICLFWYKRRQDGRDAFLLITADLRGKLAGTPKTMLKDFYEQSIPVIGQAVYRVRQFLNNEQRNALNEIWHEYQAQDKNLFGCGEEMLAGYLETALAGNPQTPWKRFADFFDKFDNCIHSRKPKN